VPGGVTDDGLALGASRVVLGELGRGCTPVPLWFFKTQQFL
jgi:hypothetical protein